jgi:hypothetical protein
MVLLSWVAIPFVNTTDTDFSVPAAANYVLKLRMVKDVYL